MGVQSILRKNLKYRGRNRKVMTSVFVVSGDHFKLRYCIQNRVDYLWESFRIDKRTKLFNDLNPTCVQVLHVGFTRNNASCRKGYYVSSSKR